MKKLKDYCANCRDSRYFEHFGSMIIPENDRINIIDGIERKADYMEGYRCPECGSIKVYFVEMERNL